MSVIDELVKNGEVYAADFDKGELALPPAKRVAVLACMDARLNPHALLGLDEGDAHVIRNAGGVVTDGEIRSLAISQRLLGTEEIMLIHHTDCGMLTFEDDEFRRSNARRASSQRGLARRSRISMRMCANRSPASRRAPSFRRRTTFVGSSTRSRPVGCGR